MSHGSPTGADTPARSSPATPYCTVARPHTHITQKTKCSPRRGTLSTPTKCRTAHCTEHTLLTAPTQPGIGNKQPPRSITQAQGAQEQLLHYACGTMPQCSPHRGLYPSTLFTSHSLLYIGQPPYPLSCAHFTSLGDTLFTPFFPPPFSFSSCQTSSHPGGLSPSLNPEMPSGGISWGSGFGMTSPPAACSSSLRLLLLLSACAAGDSRHGMLSSRVWPWALPAEQHNTVQDSASLHIQCNTVQYSAVRCSTVQISA